MRRRDFVLTAATAAAAVPFAEIAGAVSPVLAQAPAFTFARAGATNFALPGHAQDIIQSFSVGGPEARYRRVAGYSFSEFRAPAFSIVNLDAIIHAAGPLNLWLVADAAAFDREYNGSRLHAGAGVGFILDLPDGVAGSRSAVFSRIEAPFFAAGGNRFQIFLGINGQVF